VWRMSGRFRLPPRQRRRGTGRVFAVGETGVRAIIGQQVTVAGATTIAARLVERLGTPVPGLRRLGLTHTFPSADTLAAADLTGLGLPRARTGAIRSFARAVAEDSIRLDRSVSLDGQIASITAIDGLGPWTAHYLALRLGERDACPTSDLGLRRTLARHVPDSAAPLDAIAEGWRPWRALAATQLWMADGLPPRASSQPTALSSRKSTPRPLTLVD
jgi:AraC family transcriptional regulator of adaptative response / DNA-3-methyladenine glycosylase II